MTTDPIPVTVLSGTLGAGKTTLLNRLLADPGDREVAVVVNDMGEINVDADLLSRSSDDSGIVDLSNGCICCRLRDDLLTEVVRLAEEREFDALVVESSGISEPVPVARTFTEGTDESDVDPTAYYQLDTMVTVLDAYGFWKEFDAGASLPDSADPETDRPLADVLVEGIEFCDVLLLNKCDLVPDEQLNAIEATLRTLQPRAEIVRTTHADIEPERVLDTGLFDFEAATRSAGWKRTLAGHDHEGESAAEQHGVSSFVYERERPFHPERLDAWLDAWDEGVVRAKGVFRLAGREDVMGLNQAGPSVQAGPIGTWRADDDRRTRLVFIGTEMNGDEIVSALDDCLVGDEERGDSFADPFPTA
ncbi:GTP-binding protein [Halococcus sp. IIIV-5B]|uniref:CobW family GTP-binding protein n=1 Tax=Halococcus sp. IIIV-5B TaxID=2321230 RepID=UPI000E7089FA|nr:GTP-binding protein [Halococcus sp. IIIV-5B]RJS99655.1 GTP-binding protein [Halococcus sp. IIIV-5B]